MMQVSKLQAHSEARTAVDTLALTASQSWRIVSVAFTLQGKRATRVTRMTFLALVYIHLFQFRFAWFVTLMLCRVQVLSIETAVSETDVFAFSTCMYDIIPLDHMNNAFVGSLRFRSPWLWSSYVVYRSCSGQRRVCFPWSDGLFDHRTWIDSTCPNCTLRACMDPEFLDDQF